MGAVQSWPFCGHVCCWCFYFFMHLCGRGSKWLISVREFKQLQVSVYWMLSYDFVI